jgi:hypothetical protein
LTPTLSPAVHSAMLSMLHCCTSDLKRRRIYTRPGPSLNGDRRAAVIGDRHPDNGDPPRAGAYRSRLYGGQPFTHEAIQHRVSKAVSQHLRHAAPVRAAREHAERPALVAACRHVLPGRSCRQPAAIYNADGWSLNE